jgi:hypothetical protein
MIIMKIRLLKPEEIEVRVTDIYEKMAPNGKKRIYANILLYKNSRVDMQILDETFGITGWQKRYTNGNKNCIVSIWDEDKKQWIEKEDVGMPSEGQYADKGLASDSFKRACVNLGIGRELYTFKGVHVQIRPNEAVFVQGRPVRLLPEVSFHVHSIEYDENFRTVKAIRIVDGNNSLRLTSFKEDFDSQGHMVNPEFNPNVQNRPESHQANQNGASQTSNQNYQPSQNIQNNQSAQNMAQRSDYASPDRSYQNRQSEPNSQNRQNRQNGMNNQNSGYQSQYNQNNTRNAENNERAENAGFQRQENNWNSENQFSHNINVAENAESNRNSDQTFSNGIENTIQTYDDSDFMDEEEFSDGFEQNLNF